MRLRTIAVFVMIAAAAGLSAAEEAPAPKTSKMREVLRARMEEDAKKAPGPAAATPAKSDKNGKAETAPVAQPAPTAPTAAQPGKDTTAKSVAQQPATVLPKMEVKKGRITELDQKLAKQDEDIAREKKNTQPSELDLALNDSKVATPLSVFGGESAQFRKRIASERVELMESEKDIIEAIARAKTKKEKEELQKQLDQLRAVRRELEKSLR